MSALRQRTGPLAVLAMVTLIGAGCGSNAPAETGAAGSSGAAGHKQATDRDKAVKFAECMRANGVSNFPDPNASGEFVYGVSVSPAVFKQAVDACKDLQPPGTLSSKRTSKQQSATLRLANCVRANGVKDFPDPVNGEPVVDTNKIPSSNRPGGMTILNAALQKCRNDMQEVLGGQR